MLLVGVLNARLRCVPTGIGSHTHADREWPLVSSKTSHHDRTSGISIPQAGFGQVTVRAQIQAMTLAVDPSASFAFG